MSLFEMFMNLDLCINREVVIWGIDDDKEDWEELYSGPVYDVPLWVLIQPFISMFIADDDPDILHFSVEFDLPNDEE